ncbi:hypothetical protein CEUSTIGMA_g963.t1 [Chlamydomonas eustigma]|uniref:RAP domain-containing protein n=1 Tax=Chlamydomonas eustigma TaxID=1157962 RepID=A0A250WRV2_9CHLO|nr:hypothetical protein CEUSTIGMA_g963.t1 [Chlamydomonas eustigma]|eukprot:GAX73511.1 hypothetical protein CEUSTIGMA_g963.t1 [Chlamydomonas eustigma]
MIRTPRADSYRSLPASGQLTRAPNHKPQAVPSLSLKHQLFQIRIPTLSHSESCRAKFRRSSQLPVYCKTGRRRPMISVPSKLSAKQRKRSKYKDIPRRLVGITPDQPEFEGRVLTELSSARGPLQLNALVLQFGPSLTPSHLAAALSRLAGFQVLAAPKGGLPQDSEAIVSLTARRCAAVLLYKCEQVTPMQTAQCMYALSKLGVYDKGLCDALTAQTYERLNVLPPDSLAALITGCGAFEHKPAEPEWLDRFSLESYARMGRFSGPEIANMLHAFMRLHYTPSAAWLSSAQRAFKASFGTSCTAPALAKALFALAKLGVKPSFNWMSSFLTETRRLIDMLTPRELSAILWACQTMNHVPDQLFMEVWFRCSTRRMATFPRPALIIALETLATLSKGLPAPDKFTAALLPRLMDVLPAASAAEVSSVLCCLVKLRVRPDLEWMTRLEEVISEASKLAELTPPSLASLYWALAQLRYQPSPTCVGALELQVIRLVPQMSAQQLEVVSSSCKALQLQDGTSLMIKSEDKHVTTKYKRTKTSGSRQFKRNV